MLETNRIYFKGNPYPNGYKIKKFIWSGRLDKDEQLWFDFHLETDKYYSEDDTKEDEDDDEVDSDWEAKNVWENYHTCTISSTEWDSRGIKLDTSKGKFDFNGLHQNELTVDTLPLQGDWEFDDLLFQIKLLGHDSCANHQISFSKKDKDKFDIEWRGKIALTHSGDDEFKYDFVAFLKDVSFDGFYIPKNKGVESAKEAFGRVLKDMDGFHFVDVNPKSNKREYKLMRKELSLLT